MSAFLTLARGSCLAKPLNLKYTRIMSYSSGTQAGGPTANMQAANRLQNVLKAGKKAFGGWQVSPRNYIPLNIPNLTCR